MLDGASSCANLNTKLTGRPLSDRGNLSVFTRERMSTIAPDQFAGDDNTLNMAGPLIDLQPFDIAIVAFDRIFIRISPIAMYQDGLRCCLRRRQSLVYYSSAPITARPSISISASSWKKREISNNAVAG